MAKSKIYFRADGGNNKGLGHLIRSMALAEMLHDHFTIIFCSIEIPAEVKEQLKSSGFGVVEITAEAEYISLLLPADIAVLDGYGFDIALQKAIKQTGAGLVFIDDLNNQHFVADVVINHALTADASLYSAEPYSQVLTGGGYALLRKPFLEPAAKANRTGRFSHVFVCLGGSDKENLSFDIATMLAGMDNITTINILVGSAYLGDVNRLKAIHQKIRVWQNVPAAQIVELMTQSDFAVVSASGVAYECAAVSLPFIAGYYIDHQRQFYEALVQQSNVLGIGEFKELQIEKLNKAIHQLRSEYDPGSESFIDGKQQERFLKVFKALSER